MLGIVIAPAAALIVMGRPDHGAFWLTTAALAAAIGGPLLTSMFLAEPNYEVILAWDLSGCRATGEPHEHDTSR